MYMIFVIFTADRVVFRETSGINKIEKYQFTFST